MASVTNEDIQYLPASVNVIDRRLAAAAGEPDATQHPQTAAVVTLTQFHPSFTSIIGSSPSYALLLSSAEASKKAFFSAACVHLSDLNELFTTSAPLQPSYFSRLPVVLISKIKFREDGLGNITSVEWQKLRPPSNMPMPASAVLLSERAASALELSKTTGVTLFCSQGTMAPGETGGLYVMAPGQPPTAILTNYYGRQFNSPYSVAVDLDGNIWFTDPWTGHEGDFRNQPRLPAQVYCFDPNTKDVRAVADGFQRPVGIVVDHDRNRVYVSDAASDGPEDAANSTASGSIYAFDVTRVDGAPFLTNRRLFAFARKGRPAQLMCTSSGNVWAACGDGIEIWNAAGTLLGVIEIPDGATSFCLGKNDSLFICGESRLWQVQLRNVDRALI